MKKITGTFLCLILMAGMMNAFSQTKKSARYNVLFIVVDDLRPELGCYGTNNIKSPNIDKLASQGMAFENAYCQQAVCSPSRTSVLTGLRPDVTKVYDLVTHFRTNVPDVVTLPQHFKNNGYQSVGIGKIFHQDFGFDPIGLEDAPSWSEPIWSPEGKSGRGYIKERNITIANKHNGRGPAMEGADVPDNAYQDGQIADSAVRKLSDLKGKSFFLAVGFHKPHLPFTAPKKYWDMYNENDIILPDTTGPINAPRMALQDFGELRAYQGIPKKGKLSDSLARRLIHGYKACVSYTDAQIGKVLDELKRLGLDKNTIVVLWGDHGWKLNDYGNWSKHSNMEVDTRAPLIVYSPKMKAKGKASNALVEFLDIYPTICEEAGLSLPKHLQGESFSTLLNNSGQEFREYALSQFPRKDVMGYSLRTKDFRYTTWRKQDSLSVEIAVELYDHIKDPGETRNVANQPEYSETIKKMNNFFLRYKS